jgi:filamentous hemagglutinin
LRESMMRGWNGPAVDAVETAEGVVSIDNTRVAIARQVGIEEIPVRVHLPSDPLPGSMLGRFGDAQTWGEALAHRTSNQRPPLPFCGTPDTPLLRA